MRALSSFLLLLTVFTAYSLTYTVSFEKVNAHYVSVQMEFETDQPEVFFKVPVWTPGSYKVREFSNAYENVQAVGCDIARTNKNTWSIKTNSRRKITLSYDVYCFVRSVRQSYADQFFAYLHGVSAFGYIEGKESEAIVIHVKPRSDWEQVEVALPRTSKSQFVFQCENYDLLADSPIACGNFDTSSYESGNVPHKIVMMGKGNYNLKKVTKDFKKITDEEVRLFGEHPSPHIYVHFIQNIRNGSGGLEHQNCHTSSADPDMYSDNKKYVGFLGLIAHEYFHLWNVKRIRPIQLGPFDYDKENYTDMLWIAEGVTSYYDDKTLYRTGFMNKKEYLGIVTGQINRYENTAGKNVMSLAESSNLAWVKGYLPNENSHNTSISYYNKGMIAALMLDLEIMKASNETSNLDEVLLDLYSFYKTEDRGFTHQEFIEICSKRAQKDLTPFFKTFIFSTAPIDYEAYFNYVGVEIEDLNAGDTIAWTGASTFINSNRIFINRIVAGSPAENAGLSVNDEIISVNGSPLISDFDELVKELKVGQTISVEFARVGNVHSTDVKLARNPAVKYQLKAVDKNKAYKCWLKKS